MANRGGNKLRIIGGEWRGRKLSFPDVEGLRPTTDRVRETLFNWLAPVIHGAHCLDLFSGSGALGLEALSRGASGVTFVDSSGQVMRSLKENLSLLKVERARLEQVDALSYLRGDPQRYDVVFLDPPFHKGLLQPCLEKLCQGGWMAQGARIYFEMEQDLDEPELPYGWEMVRRKAAGQVVYGLLMRGE